MKKQAALLAIVFGSFAISFFGCVKDKCQSTYHYTYYVPVFRTAAEVRANIRSNAPKPVERPGKIYVLGRYIFLNEIDKGIHIIDNSNPASPVNKAFIDIPGSVDLAVKGHTLYADLYTDLVAIDISNPLNASVTKVVEGVFPERYYSGIVSNGNRVIADWIQRDTVVTEDCSEPGFRFDNTGVFVSYAANSSSGKASAVAPYGAGGSMARFTIVGNRLYTVGNADLSVFNVGNEAQPSFTKKTSVGWNIETIYPFKDNLFIGSSVGMFMYSISNPDNPVQLGQFQHVFSCDPVIADDDYAYVTLRSGTACRGAINQLDVLRLNSLTDPSLVKSYPLTNPHGLSKDGNLLFICDGTDGLKLFDASDPANLQLRNVVAGIETEDVITLDGIALVVAKDGLYQYDYSNPANIRMLSKLTIQQ